MTLLAPLPATLTDEVLGWLDVPPPRHERAWLDELMRQYGQRVPWESASRIARHRTLPADAHRLTPETFWQHAMADGTGGTCFESNGALAALLATLGFDGHLTINDMDTTRACHTAIVVHQDGERWLVDAGYPIYAALPLRDEVVTVNSPWFTYTTAPLADGRYVIENRPHPKPYLFHLIDTAVPPDAYIAATCADYGPTGLFLDRVVLRKIVDGRVTRFVSDERPWEIRTFVEGVRSGDPIGDTVNEAAPRIAAHFGIPPALIARALVAVT
jgi:hypothetical protein